MPCKHPPARHPTLPPDPQRRALLRASSALLAGAAWPAARACEFFASTLRISHPWARATAPDERSALVHMKIDEVLENDSLIAASTPLAEGVVLGRQGGDSVLRIDIPAGQWLQFGGDPEDPVGTPTLRLLGLTERLVLGSSFPLRLQFARAGHVNAALSIDYAGLRFSRINGSGLQPSC